MSCAVPLSPQRKAVLWVRPPKPPHSGTKSPDKDLSPMFHPLFPGSSASLFHSTVCPHKTTDMPIFPPQMYFSVMIDAIFTSHHLSSSEEPHQHHCSIPNFYKILKLLYFPANHEVPLQPRHPQGEKGRDSCLAYLTKEAQSKWCFASQPKLNPELSTLAVP